MPVQTSLQEQLAGSWRLVSFERRFADGTVSFPYGSKPDGKLIYTADGTVAVQVYNGERPAFAAPIAGRGTTDEMAAAYESHLAYFGTYRVDEAQRLVTHAIARSAFPNQTGAQENRHVELNDEVLTLRAEGRMQPGAQAVVVWHRTGPVS